MKKVIIYLTVLISLCVGGILSCQAAIIPVPLTSDTDLSIIPSPTSSVSDYQKRIKNIEYLASSVLLDTVGGFVPGIDNTDYNVIAGELEVLMGKTKKLCNIKTNRGDALIAEGRIRETIVKIAVAERYKKDLQDLLALAIKPNSGMDANLIRQQLAYAGEYEKVVRASYTFWSGHFINCTP